MSLWTWLFPPRIKTAEELVNKCKGLRTTCRWIQFYVFYKKNPEWVTSEWVLRYRIADCKGFAVLVFDALTLLGYEPHIWGCLQMSVTGHAIVLFKENSHWNYVSNGVLKMLPSTVETEHEAVMAAMPDYGMYKQVDKYGKTISIL